MYLFVVSPSFGASGGLYFVIVSFRQGWGVPPLGSAVPCKKVFEIWNAFRCIMSVYWDTFSPFYVTNLCLCFSKINQNDYADALNVFPVGLAYNP